MVNPRIILTIQGSQYSSYNSVSSSDYRFFVFGRAMSVTPINGTFICQTHLAKSSLGDRVCTYFIRT